MAPIARRTHTDWAATRIAALRELVFRMLWSVASGLFFLSLHIPLAASTGGVLRSNNGLPPHLFFEALHT
jgi:hypothetical protein